MILDIADVEAVLEKLLRKGARPVLFEGVTIPFDVAAAADGLLPLFLLTGEALWREVKGEGFGLTTQPDEGALLGYRLAMINAGSFTMAMLATMEAISQACGPNGIVVEKLGDVWSASNERVEADQRGKEQRQ
ncbi:hypothetical protein [Methylosinus sp. RM1]|uniref:hypothetical protein n=1 Tax=Methylosinus sp. RM1 TaxID=2583817 RepID=UPI001407738B|nr:hypothetical protein [Methylosinus sp. RM1]